MGEDGVHDKGGATLRLAVQGAWVADNMKRLGSGAFYHLAYPAHQVHPEVLAKLKAGTPSYGRVEIYLLRGERGVLIADGELIAVHWFPHFIRVHLMIVNVYVERLGHEVRWENPAYFVTGASKKGASRQEATKPKDG